MVISSEASILINSKTFDPKAFLPAVHPNATYQDLLSGVNHLKSSLEGRSGAIRILVEDNFDRFVAVKASTDGAYSHMCSEFIQLTFRCSLICGDAGRVAGGRH